MTTSPTTTIARSIGLALCASAIGFSGAAQQAAAATITTDPGTFATLSAGLAGTSSTPITFGDVAMPSDGSNVAPISATQYAGWNLSGVSSTNTGVAVLGTGYAFGTAATAVAPQDGTELVLGLTNPGVVAVDFNVAVFGGGPVEISVKDGTSTISTQTFTALDETQLTSFVGVVDTSPITEIDVTALPVGNTTATFPLVTNLQYTTAPVPEPSSAALMAAVCVGLAVVGRRRPATRSA